MNILVIKHGALGDFVQALGAMRAIRLHHKDAKITLLTTKPYVELAQSTHYFNTVVADTRPKWFELPKLLALRKFLNDGKFERVYDLQNSERTSLYPVLFKKLPKWNGARVKPTHPLKSVHIFNALRAQLALAGVSITSFDTLSWMEADVFPLQVPKPYVLVVAGCSPSRPEKRWPVANYAAICQWLAEAGVTPVLLGTKDEADVNAQIKAVCPKAYDLTGYTTLAQVVVLARQARAAVGNDTGPIQMIGPTGCNTLGLYPGFSNPKRHGPLGPNVITIQKERMADISVDEVRGALEKFISPPASGS